MSESYTGVQKAAILLITLGPEKAATIFKHLKEDEIEELTLEIANTRLKVKNIFTFNFSLFITFIYPLYI